MIKETRHVGIGRSGHGEDAAFLARRHGVGSNRRLLGCWNSINTIQALSGVQLHMIKLRAVKTVRSIELQG